jgi:hypothetical protein
MPELALPPPFADSEPQLVYKQVGPDGGGIVVQRDGSLSVFSASGEGLWRLRMLNISGAFGGTVGTNVLTLQIWIGSTASPYGRNMLYTSAVQFDFGPTDAYCVTWSTDLGAHYGGQRDASLGRVFNVPIPLFYFPAGVDVGVGNSGNPGADADATIDNGAALLEYFASPGGGRPGAAGNSDLYLLPALG